MATSERADRQEALEALAACLPFAEVVSLGPATTVGGVIIVSELLRVFRILALGLMIENHSKDRLVKEVLMMELVMHTKKNDIVFHTETAGLLTLVVEIDVGGMTADVVDKLTCSSYDVQPKQVDLRRKSVQKLHVYMKLFQLHIVDVHIVQEQ
nr:hypothetical protein [Tanacetum cinerariifolium]